MTKNEYKILRKYQKMKPSEFLEYAFGIKLFAYQKMFLRIFQFLHKTEIILRGLYNGRSMRR